MNNLHRELAPISSAAWEDLETETRRTLSRHLAGRRVVDVDGPDGLELAAIGTGRRESLPEPSAGVVAARRLSVPMIELKVPFTVDREEVDDVARGAQDADWEPAKEAARKLAFAEDRLITDGLASAGISGLRTPDTASVQLSDDVMVINDTVARAVSKLRLAGVDGPWALLLSADLYTLVSESSDHGVPIIDQVQRVLGSEGKIIWAPAITGAVLLSTRGGDFSLRLGQDTSIGYHAHDHDTIELYLQESITFLNFTPEAAVTLQ
ncbi:bacteriocin [Microlunatus elymi]|uniref:Type 1 encapsulin shell protein n=1 Tax=Microlunatus elymi TaxID=2596828 RepID=A0A516PVM1_9ACTN|nr:family 1 encapsulin nanocompartment shell protein [Microlunatus elymi]QDP95234.1 bacteriocin [Microlunatus elymi]